jgi:hypothetical protein
MGFDSGSKLDDGAVVEGVLSCHKKRLSAKAMIQM